MSCLYNSKINKERREKEKGRRENRERKKGERGKERLFNRERMVSLCYEILFCHLNLTAEELLCLLKPAPLLMLWSWIFLIPQKPYIVNYTLINSTISSQMDPSLAFKHFMSYHPPNSLSLPTASYSYPLPHLPSQPTLLKLLILIVSILPSLFMVPSDLEKKAPRN